MFFLNFEVWVKDSKVFDLTSDSDSSSPGTSGNIVLGTKKQINNQILEGFEV